MPHRVPLNQPARLAIAAGALLALAPAAAGQFFTTTYVKRSTFVQTGNDTLQPMNDWLLTIDCATVYSNIASMRVNEQPMQHAPGSLVWTWNSTFYPGLAELDAAYPNSAVLKQEITPSGGFAELVYMSPLFSFMPSQPPRFVGGAYDALQNANPNIEIHLHTDGFAPSAHSTAAFTTLDVFDLIAGKFIYSVEAPSAAPQNFVIPPGTLKPDGAYYVQASYRGVRPSTFNVGSIGYLLFQPTGMYRTQLTFLTRRCTADLTGDGLSDLEDFFAFFNCWDLASPCADIDGSPGVDLGDFFAFFDAFDVAC